MGLSKNLSKGVGSVNRESHARFGKSDFGSLDPPWTDMRPSLGWQGAPAWRAFSPQLSFLPETRVQPAQARIHAHAHVQVQVQRKAATGQLDSQASDREMWVQCLIRSLRGLPRVRDSP